MMLQDSMYMTDEDIEQMRMEQKGGQCTLEQQPLSFTLSDD